MFKINILSCLDDFKVASLYAFYLITYEIILLSLKLIGQLKHA